MSSCCYLTRTVFAMSPLFSIYKTSGAPLFFPAHLGDFSLGSRHQPIRTCRSANSPLFFIRRRDPSGICYELPLLQGLRDCLLFSLGRCYTLSFSFSSPGFLRTSLSCSSLAKGPVLALRAELCRRERLGTLFFRRRFLTIPFSSSKGKEVMRFYSQREAFPVKKVLGSPAFPWSLLLKFFFPFDRLLSFFCRRSCPTLRPPGSRRRSSAPRTGSLRLPEAPLEEIFLSF